MRTSRSGNEDGNRGALFILAQVIQNGITEPGNAREGQRRSICLSAPIKNGITERGNAHEGRRERVLSLARVLPTLPPYKERRLSSPLYLPYHYANLS